MVSQCVHFAVCKLELLSLCVVIFFAHNIHTYIYICIYMYICYIWKYTHVILCVFLLWCLCFCENWKETAQMKVDICFLFFLKLGRLGNLPARPMHWIATAAPSARNPSEIVWNEPWWNWMNIISSIWVVSQIACSKTMAAAIRM